MQAGGGSWKTHSVGRRQVMRRMDPIRMWVPAAWPYVLGVVDRACAAGMIVEDQEIIRDS
jgi:hypothetical protein